MTWRDTVDLDISWLTTDQAAEFIEVQPARVSDWKRRGLLTPIWTDHAGRPRYLARHVVEVEAATRRPWRLRKTA